MITVLSALSGRLCAASIPSSVCGSGSGFLGKYRNSATNVKRNKKKSVTVLILEELGGRVNGRMIFI